MKSQINPVLLVRIQAEEVAIKHVRQPSYTVPIAGMGGVESPCDAVEIQTRANDRILVNVIVIIVTNESQVTDRPQAGKSNQQQRRQKELVASHWEENSLTAASKTQPKIQF